MVLCLALVYVLQSGPRLLEPMYLCDITVPLDKVSGVYTTLQARRGRICPEAEDGGGGNMQHVKAFLPVLESFGFTQLLRQNTAGKVSCLFMCAFNYFC